jgi:basic membrane protein A
MVKEVDAVVFDAVRRVNEGTFAGGIYSYGLAEEGVGYVYDENNRDLIPDRVRERVEQLRDSVIAGHISVPSTR